MYRHIEKEVLTLLTPEQAVLAVVLFYIHI